MITLSLAETTSVNSFKEILLFFFQGENTIVHVTEVLHPEIKHFFCMRSKCPFTSTTVADLQSHTLRYHAVFGDDGPLKQVSYIIYILCILK